MTDLHARLMADLDPTTPWDADRDEHVYAALRAVVELHAPGQGGGRGDLICDGPCREPWGDSSEYPCSTIQAIARELEVDGG